MEDAMAKILGVVAIVALSVTLVLIILTIWMEINSATQYLELTQALLSWQVIAGGLAVGAGNTFQNEIAALLRKLG